MKMSNEMYDVLAFIGRIVLPALAVFYKSLGGIWVDKIPYPAEIASTIMAIDLLLNSLLGISSNAYYKEVAQASVNNYDTEEPENLG